MTMGVIYFVVHDDRRFSYRVPPTRTGSPRVGRRQRISRPTAMITTRHVHVSKAWQTPQFWLLWGILTPERVAPASV